MKKILLLALIYSLTLSTFSACENIVQGTNHDSSVSQTIKTEEMVIFTDDIGREVPLPAKIDRIVPSSFLSQIILYAIAPEMMVGLSEQWEENGQGIIDNSHFDLPVFGNLYSNADLNVEELALSSPQIIIDIGEPKETLKEDMDTLESQTNIPSVFISSSLQTMPKTFRTLGQLLGKEDKGEELASYCEKIYARTIRIMEQVGTQKTDTLYILGEDGLNVITSASYHSELIDLITNNLAVTDHPLSKGTGNKITMEQLMLWNPDFIIFGSKSIYSEVLDMETWNQMNAIQNHKYIEVPDVPHDWMGMPPSVQRYLALIWLPYVLYPEYCNYNIKEEIVEYYRLFYGYELSDQQYDTITQNAFLTLSMDNHRITGNSTKQKIQ